MQTDPDGLGFHKTLEGSVAMSICMNPRCDGTNYLCGKCRKLYPMLAASLDEKKRQRRSGNRGERRGGTMNSTAFRSRQRRDSSGKTDTWFNEPGDKSQHGHVVESTDESSNQKYHYVRDVEGNIYRDDSKD